MQVEGSAKVFHQINSAVAGGTPQVLALPSPAVTCWAKLYRPIGLRNSSPAGRQNLAPHVSVGVAVAAMGVGVRQGRQRPPHIEADAPFRMDSFSPCPILPSLPGLNKEWLAQSPAVTCWAKLCRPQDWG